MKLSHNDENKTRAWIWTRRLIPSIGGVIGVFIFAIVLADGSRLLLDGDTGWHIRTGDYILENMEVPRVDIFSHRKYGAPWIAHEWLSDAIFAVVHRTAGLNGLVVFSAGVVAFTIVLLFRLLQSYRFNILTVTAVTVLAALASSAHWLARPHLFSLCLSVAWYSLLESLQNEPQSKKRYLFPFLMILWINLHGGFLFGFALLGIYGIGNLLGYILNQASERKFYKIRIATLLRIGLLCFAGAHVNPYGFHLLSFPFEILGSTAQMNDIAEWRSPNFHRFTAYEFYLLLFIAACLATRQKFRSIEILLALFVTHSSLVSQRFIPFFAIIMAPLLGRRIDALYEVAISTPTRKWFLNVIQERFRKSVENLQMLNDGSQHYGFIIGITVVAFLIAANGGNLFGEKILDFKFGGGNYPIAAIEFLKRNPLPGKMFNFYSYGGYLIYEFYPDPRYRVFVDGRATLDGDDYFVEFLKVNTAAREWKEILRVYGVNWIIYPADSWLSTLVLQGTDWKLIYADPNTNIFIRNIPQNQALIDKFSNVKPAS